MLLRPVLLLAQYVAAPSTYLPLHCRSFPPLLPSGFLTKVRCEHFEAPPSESPPPSLLRPVLLDCCLLLTFSQLSSIPSSHHQHHALSSTGSLARLVTASFLSKPIK
ncbi:uncharacterized protein F5Z01DRAFT_37044 [Emericellopsis atlantica]|uniref:Secreted protein n=1 Tax=Emericellopsis atlantica TaxID=2614577 RepID=A0A9P7ZN61_9HYPO|nr:uncharacterized protein F5Z01DRAFT_37044 [Emericellopsis atlantica]KAG9255203.1 hypothetical protein F5Z01DRAFT_37044 [Emericellopsis atlantica]